eukprot:4765602-Alexandrium_andersonii.AAC.1
MVTIATVYPDSMHVVDLGVCQHVLGNAIFHLVATDTYIVGPAAEYRLEQVWLRIVGHYRHRSTPVQLGNLLLSM